MNHELGPLTKAIFHDPTSCSRVYTGPYTTNISYLRTMKLVSHNYAIHHNFPTLVSDACQLQLPLQVCLNQRCELCIQKTCSTQPCQHSDQKNGPLIWSWKCQRSKTQNQELLNGNTSWLVKRVHTTKERVRKHHILFHCTPSVPKWLSYFLDFVCPKIIVRLFAWLEIGAQSQIFCTKSSISRSRSTPQLPGAFWSRYCFLFQESYLQLSGQWSASLAQVRKTDNHFGMEGVHDFVH